MSRASRELAEISQQTLLWTTRSPLVAEPLWDPPPSTCVCKAHLLDGRDRDDEEHGDRSRHRARAFADNQLWGTEGGRAARGTLLGGALDGLLGPDTSQHLSLRFPLSFLLTRFLSMFFFFFF